MPSLLSGFSSRLATLRGLLRDPDRLRVYVCNRIPWLPATSPLIRCLYTAWWKYQVYRFSFRCRNGDAGTKPNGRNRYLLRVPSAAGIGDQIVTCWSETYMLARKHGLTFAHHPFRRSYHCPDVDWEAFLGFGEGEVQAAELLSDNRLMKVYLPPLSLTSPQDHLILSRLINRVYRQDNVVFHLGTGVYLGSDIEQGEVMPSVYQHKYQAARSRSPMAETFDQCYVHVAVHIRRGDLALLKDDLGEEWNKRWIDLSYYANVLGDLLAALATHRTQVHIFSDGTADELAELQSFPNTRLHLGDDPLESFHAMVTADVLVVSTSAFAVCAGKICPGIKLAGKDFDSPQFRLFIPGSEDWIQIEPDGHFSPDTDRRIGKLLRAQVADRVWAT
jgi:hypothetical protein